MPILLHPPPLLLLSPSSSQVELHPLWRQDRLVSFCRSHGIHVSAHTPLGTPASAPDVVSSPARRPGEGGHPSSLSLSLSPAPPPPAAAVPWWEAPPPPGKGKSRSVHGPMLRHTDVREVANKYGKTGAQVREPGQEAVGVEGWLQMEGWFQHGLATEVSRTEEVRLDDWWSVLLGLRWRGRRGCWSCRLHNSMASQFMQAALKGHNFT